eukprot:15399257-Alexandrium_andersonii.AAC.1
MLVGADAWHSLISRMVHQRAGLSRSGEMKQRGPARCHQAEAQKGARRVGGRAVVALHRAIGGPCDSA